jgi:hypothetical protein
MKPGEVYLHFNFPLPNGEEREKYFVVLNCEKTQPTLGVLVATTTSNGFRYKKAQPEGCGHPFAPCYALRPNQYFFKDHTWVQFDQILEFKSEPFHGDVKVGHAVLKYTFPKDAVASLLKCAHSSDDITGHQKESIKTAMATNRS